MSRFDTLRRVASPIGRSLRMSRLAFFQLVLLGLALAVLWVLAVRPWLEVRTKARSQELLNEDISLFEADFGSLDPATYQPEPVPAELNVAHWALAGGAALLDDQGFHDELSQFYRDPEGFDLARTAARDGLRRNQATLDLLLRMADLDRSDFGLDYRRGNDLRLPDPDHLYGAGSLLALDALVAASEGREDDAVRALRSLDALTGAVAAEAPMPLYIVSVRLESLLVRTLRSVSGMLPAEDLGAFVDIAAAPAYAGGLCTRLRRTAFFDAAVRVARGPDPQLLQQVERYYLPKRFWRRSDIHWVSWAHAALPALGAYVRKCDDMEPLRGLGLLVLGGSSDFTGSQVLDHHALWILQPELGGLLEIARRTRHQRLMAAIGLRLMEAADRRGVEPTEIDDLPAMFTDPTIAKLAGCTEVRDVDGVATLVPVSDRAECPFWAHESLHWPLERVLQAQP